MSREQTLPSPATRDTQPFEDLAPLGEGQRLVTRILTLAVEARDAFDSRRAELAGDLNALLAQLPLEADPRKAAETLHRLFEEKLLDDLEDPAGVPSRIAATRALLALGYPHALEVSPELLEALRRWERRSSSPVSWLSMVVTLGAAALVQMLFVPLFGSGTRMLFGLSAAMLAGEQEPRTWEDRVRGFWWSFSGAVSLGQFALTAGAFLLTLVVAGEPKGRSLARNVFFGLGVLGMLLGAAQLPYHSTAAWGTFASAASSLAAGWMLRERRPSP